MVQIISKLLVVRIPQFFKPQVRHLGGLTTLEKYERLRQLCCTSDVAKKQEESVDIRPRTREIGQDCEECCGVRPKELLDIRCKTAMVLGGASGIGFETADNLLKAGALRVIIADVNQCAGVESVKKLCTTYGSNKAIFLMCDLREQPSIEMAFKEIYRYFKQMEIYINCAGIYNETPKCWEHMIKTNLIGCARGTILAYKYLSKNTAEDCCQGSVIVNVSSYGYIANVPSMPLFSAASGGITGLTSSFGQDFHFSRSRVRFVTVCPSCTDSGLLKSMDSRHYDRNWAGHSSAAMKCCTRQSAQFVGKAITNAARFGINGCVYVVKEGKYYRYAMPDYPKIMHKESILL